MMSIWVLNDSRDIYKLLIRIPKKPIETYALFVFIT